MYSAKYAPCYRNVFVSSIYSCGMRINSIHQYLYTDCISCVNSYRQRGEENRSRARACVCVQHFSTHIWFRRYDFAAKPNTYWTSRARYTLTPAYTHTLATHTNLFCFWFGEKVNCVSDCVSLCKYVAVQCIHFGFISYIYIYPQTPFCHTLVSVVCLFF